MKFQIKNSEIFKFRFSGNKKTHLSEIAVAQFPLELELISGDLPVLLGVVTQIWSGWGDSRGGERQLAT